MAQKKYRITLSDKDATFVANDINSQPVNVNKRYCEVDAIQSMIAYAAAKEKENLAEFNLCASLAEEVGSIEKDQKTWVIPQSDLNILRDGFKISFSREINRPFIWVRLKELFEQLENPTEVKEKEKCSTPKKSQNGDA